MIFGLIAGLITVLASLPQAVKTYTTKKAEDLSLLMWILYASASLSWAIYAYFKSDKVLLVANVITLFINSSVLIMKIKYITNRSD